MRGASQIDWDATEKRCFLDPRSVVFLDGREALFGQDMAERRMEVYRRDKGDCVYCGKFLQPWLFQLHHVVHRSNGRDDRAKNLAVSCGRCHRAQHPEKQPQWSMKV